MGGLAIFVAGGWGVGYLIGTPIAGALLGCFVGLIAVFAAVYLAYRNL